MPTRIQRKRTKGWRLPPNTVYVQRIGFTPMAMLWKPERDAAMKWAPAPEWRAFQRRWVRPAIIHAQGVA